MISIGLLVVVAIVIVLLFPHIAKRRVLGNRDNLPNDQLVRLFAASSSLPPEVILLVLNWIGSSYGIAYSKLKPDDCIISQLSKIDSWRFDVGAEKLETLIRERFGLTIPRGLQKFTILDLLKLIETRGLNGKSETKVNPTSQPKHGEDQ